MRKLSEEEETSIRNRLNYIAEDLYRDRGSIIKSKRWEDMYWAHNTIKDLLYIIYELDNKTEVKKNEGNTHGQSAPTDFGD